MANDEIGKAFKKGAAGAWPPAWAGAAAAEDGGLEADHGVDIIGQDTGLQRDLRKTVDRQG